MVQLKFPAEDVDKLVKHVYLKLEAGQNQYRRYHLAVLYIRVHYSQQVADLVHHVYLGSILQAHSPLHPSRHAHRPNMLSGKQENLCHLHLKHP